MKRFLLALFSVSVSVAQTAQAPASYRVSDITLYGLGERHAVFYGSSGVINQGTSKLTLSSSGTGIGGLQVAGSLRVNGKSSLQLAPATLSAFQVVNTNAGLRLVTRVPLKAVYYNDGTRWYTLSGQIAGSQNVPVTLTPRSSLYGAGTLTTAEATALGTYLVARGQAVAVGVIPVLPNKITFAPAPASYRSTALAVQFGVRDLSVVSDPNNGTVDSVDAIVTPLTDGTQSMYQGTELATHLDANADEFLNTWQLVAGNLIPTPPLPKVDFARSKVVTVFLGQKPTGGYGLRLLDSSFDAGALHLRLETSSPAPGRLTTQVITSPYVMLEVSQAVTSVSVELIPAQ